MMIITALEQQNSKSVLWGHRELCLAINIHDISDYMNKIYVCTALLLQASFVLAQKRDLGTGDRDSASFIKQMPDLSLGEAGETTL